MRVVHEGGRHHHQVVEVAGALPRIVGDVDVAFAASAPTGNTSRKCPTERAMVLMWPGVPVTAWASMRPCRSNTPAEMSPASRAEVLNAVRTSVCALLLHHGEQAVPHDLQFDFADDAGHAADSSMTISWPAAMRAENPVGTMVAVPASTITAGPCSVAPGCRSARANTAASTASPMPGSTMRRRAGWLGRAGIGRRRRRGRAGRAAATGPGSR